MSMQVIDFLKFNILEEPIWFKSAKEANSWGKASYKSWLDSLTTKERVALTKYTGEVFYSNINDTLRGFGSFNGANGTYCDLLTSALEKAITPEDILVYRGTSKMMLGELRNLPVNQLEGKIIEDKAFMSTSLVEGEIYDSNLILYMNVPKGAHGAYIGNLSFLQNECEFLLNRGYRMLIKKVLKNSLCYLKLEVDVLIE
ncbi:ADP-ribosyltransferase [Clostridium intestinale]|uniref:ADP ribosyltransferase domain-containing protein n=1 Tax=Clostridium intestinale TaxID=36845 RepID=A0A7D6W3W3_9CLOT|nr:ADP-ribosyltransferase [Clostridium intestinale]QLY82151.1 hypothetical protein HZF06_11350 [Clostridium intestinale]